jgi:hypothetical protein
MDNGVKLKVVPFAVEHLEQLTPREFEGRELAWLGPTAARERAALYRDLGPAFSGFMGDELMGCGGVVPLDQEVAEIWMVTTDLVARYPLAFHRAVRRGLAAAAASLKLRRLQTAIHAEHRVSRKWIQCLGFREELEPPLQGPEGAIYVRYGREEPCHF